MTKTGAAFWSHQGQVFLGAFSLFGQFSRKRSIAKAGYQQFVAWGIGKKTIWQEVKGQSVLGEDDFVEGLLPHIKKGQDIPDIPKGHRYVNRT